MRKFFLIASLLLGGLSTLHAQNRVPAFITIQPSVVGTDSIVFNLAWARVVGAASYDITFRTMPRIKQLELVRVITDTTFSVRVHKNDIPYPQITVYATAIASLSYVKIDSTRAVDSIPTVIVVLPPTSVIIDTITTIPPPPTTNTITVSRASIAFTMVTGGAIPAPQTIVATTSNAARWNTQDTSSFYNTSPCDIGSGTTCASGATATLTPPASVQSLAVGTYTSNLTFLSVGMTNVVIPVTLTVTPVIPPPTTIPGLAGHPTATVVATGSTFTVTWIWGAALNATSYNYSSGRNSGAAWPFQSGNTVGLTVSFTGVPAAISMWFCVLGVNSAGTSTENSCNLLTIP